MANKNHLEILLSGVGNWNFWRKENYNILPNLSDTNLEGMNLDMVDFTDADLRGSNLTGCSFNNARLMGCVLNDSTLPNITAKNANFAACNLVNSNCSGSTLLECIFIEATLIKTDFSNSTIQEANFYRANLTEVNFQNTQLQNSRLIQANLVEANLNFANISSCKVYGISVWEIQKEGLIQNDLIITDANQPEITVDDIEVSQFVHLILNNKKFRNVIETITSKTILILGNFSSERKLVLEALKKELRNKNYVPIIFDFDKPTNKDLTETLTILAKLSRFVIVDLTDPISVPHELASIIPFNPSIPIVPIILNNASFYAFFKDYLRYDWVLDPIRYSNIDDVISGIELNIIEKAENKITELEAKHGVRISNIK